MNPLPFDPAPLEPLILKVRAALQNCAAGPRVAAAVSGGADSVCLLLCLSVLREEGLSLFAAHVRHDLRDTAQRDELFVRELCDQLSVPLLCRSVHVPETGSAEDQARRVRYEALAQQCAQAGTDTLFLAHHLNDQAETVLMRLIRGSGPEGLSGMAPVSFRGQLQLVRPFLDVPAEEIRQRLTALSQPWCEDETNLDPHYTRNFLRHRVLVPLSAAFPQSARGIAQSAKILRDENDCLSRITEEQLSRTACLTLPCRFLSREELNRAHPALQRRLIRAFLSACGAEPGYEKTEEILAALRKPTAQINLTGGDALLLTPARAHYLPARPPAFRIPDNYLREESSAGPGDGVRVQSLPLPLYRRCALRFPRAGDRFQPFGHRAEQRLSRFLIDRKIDRPFRPFLPVLCDGDQVVWIPGVAASEQARVCPGDPCVTLALSGRLPWEIDATGGSE